MAGLVGVLESALCVDNSVEGYLCLLQVLAVQGLASAYTPAEQDMILGLEPQSAMLVQACSNPGACLNAHGNYWTGCLPRLQNLWRVFGLVFVARQPEVDRQACCAKGSALPLNLSCNCF